ncbi:MAG: putative peptidoglycan glycosyltransferase FtsW [Bifidobacteriaceae bacterium]|nr:putative peptidoglycan glycosyltransferase FtsW [Bifidobacteriaceae bacterium]
MQSLNSRDVLSRQRNAKSDRARKITRVESIRDVTNPIWCYYGFLVAVLFLTFFGMVMVFSSSTVTYISYGQSPLRQLVVQGFFAVLGLGSAFLATRFTMMFYYNLGKFFFYLALILQALTLVMGVSVQGNTGWLSFGFVTIQPAEILKYSLCVWMPNALLKAKKSYNKLTERRYRAYVYPIGGFIVAVGLVLLGHDLGTAMIVMFIGLIACIICDFPSKALFGALLAIVGVVAALVISSPNRLARILAATGSCSAEDNLGVCYQALHAKYAIASGGLFGVGIGNSREKWNYLPEAHNDFIFAIIGEETGFIGAVSVIVLYVLLGWCLVTIAIKLQKKSYPAAVLICFTGWIVGQALANISVVVGLAPVIGVPMPYVSAGGSSLVMCLIAAGTAVSMMKEEPQIKALTSKLNS